MVLKQCILCKYVYNKPTQPTVTPELPNDPDHAFHVVWVDYAGSLCCRDTVSSNNDKHKCFILLFTCAFSLAVHLGNHIIYFSADTFLSALKRFTSRRKIPTF